ncbi:unnamed protein product [Calypogeia fissa]
MPPKKLKSREGSNALLPDLVLKFPFRVGDEVEMKSFESGYRGAWFRVQIKKIRVDRKGNILSTMVYKDYTDESEEEIRVYEKDPASDERILMVRPLPPPSVKESLFNKNVHTKMCVVYRDEWEVGDLVDWWYHHCWWAAKVISVVGDGRFQLVCPAPPGGEGGVYLANSRDLRPSLKWSLGQQWTAPPSKEMGKIPCARIVWLLNSNEVSGFASPNQDKVRQKRGRPKLVRGGTSPPVRKEPTVDAPPNPDKELGKDRRPKVIQLDRSPFYNERAAEVVTPNEDTRVPQKRGRPRKVDREEEAALTRKRPFVIKIIHPRQDPGYGNVEHTLRNSSVDETGAGVNEERPRDICPSELRSEDAKRREAKQETVPPAKVLVDENRKWVTKASPVKENQPDKGTLLDIEQRTALAAKQIHGEKRHGIKQKRSVKRIPDKVNMTHESQISNGHSDEAKRRKLEHIRRVSEPEAGHEYKWKQNVQDQDGKKPQKRTADVEAEEAGRNNPKYGIAMAQPKSRKKQMKFEDNQVAVDSTLVSRTDDAVVEHVLDSDPRVHTLPSLSEGKESSADHISGQRSKDENQNGERRVEVFSSNFASNPMNGEVKIPEDDLSDGEACKEALDLKVLKDLKVLNAYEEAFTDTLCLEAKNTCLIDDPPAKEFKDAVVNDSCPTGQKSVLAKRDLTVVTAHEEGVTTDIRLPRKKNSVAQDPLPANSKFSKSGECPVSCNQEKLLNGNAPLVSSACQGICSLDTKSSALQDRLTEKAAKLSAIMSHEHEFLIGTEASSMDTISVGGTPDSSFSGRVATVSIEEDMKDTASSHGGASVVDEQDSWSSLELSQVNQSRKSADVRVNPSRDVGMKAEKSDMNEISSLKKRKTTKPVTKRKVSLSRKLIDQARREVSAKRRRSCRSAGRGEYGNRNT